MINVPFLDEGIFIMQAKMDRINKLKSTAYSLRQKYYDLVPAVRQSLIDYNVDVEGAKVMIREFLKGEAPQLKECINHLEKVPDYNTLFSFLSKNNFIGYLNYVLLKRLSKLVSRDNDLMSKIDKYEKEYSELLDKASCSNLLHLFNEWSIYSPTAPVGLPRFSFCLDESWLDEKFSDWVIIYDEFSWSSESFLAQLRKNCIIVTYAIPPSILDDVLRDLRDPEIIKKLASRGVTVLELPQEGKGEFSDMYILLKLL